MPIQSDDIKLLKSAVMADVPEGGGGATGVEIADGVSNNIFNDISTDDRAQGAFHLRKLFGIAQTDNADTLLGAGFSVLEPPSDANVSVLLFETPGWFDERTEAVDLVERYLVKGPLLVGRVSDVHYTGTSLLQMYNVAPGAGFPQPGEAIVLRNPNGQEQYVRALRVVQSQETVQTDDSSAYAINLATITLDRPLAFDLLGKPIQRIAPSTQTTAGVFSTTPSEGAVFYGVKPLGEPAAVGDRSVTVDGGILANLVPASSVPEPVLDEYPLIRRPTLSRTAAAALTLPAVTTALAPGAVLQLPTAVEPGTLTMQHGATAFTSTIGGDLLQGSTVVGSVDHAGRRLTLLGSAPSYPSASNTITYRPATRTGATAHSIGVEVTQANQSTAWVFALAPAPAPGTVSFSYLFNGVWYELLEDGSGKLAGADSSYGTGQMNFITGSLAASLGALPDVGSQVIVMWGEADSAEAATGLPARAWTRLPLDSLPDGPVLVSWARGATGYSASVAPGGAVTGPAQARPVVREASGFVLPFSPDVLPDGPVTLTYTPLDSAANFANNGGGQYTLNGGNPIRPGSVRFQAIASASGGNAAWAGTNQVFDCYSEADVVYARGLGPIGTINNATGVMVLSHPAFSVTGYEKLKSKYIFA